MYSHRDQHYAQHHDAQHRPTLPPLSTYLAPQQVAQSIPAHTLYQQHQQQTPHYQQSLPSLSQLLNQPGQTYTAQQQQQLLEQQQYAYAQQQQQYSMPVNHMQQQQAALYATQYSTLPASPPPPVAMRYASPAPQQQQYSYAQSSPPASPTAGTPTAARPFACDRCQAGFSRPHDLKRHRASVHFRNDAEGPTCGRCGRPFSRSDALRRHTQRGCHVGEDTDS